MNLNHPIHLTLFGGVDEMLKCEALARTYCSTQKRDPGCSLIQGFKRVNLLH